MKKWDPSSFLQPHTDDSAGQESLQTALVVINTPIVRLDIFKTVWHNAALRYCADGGANRLYDAFGSHSGLIPDLIKGDLDSLRADVRAFYEAKDVPVVQDNDQYATDLGKCVKALQEVEKKSGKQFQLVIFGGLSGRFDQTAHTIHTLFTLRKAREWTWVVSEESLTCLLEAGSHTLHTSKHLLGKTCGLLPIGIDSAQVSTSGLEWNLDDTETSFETMVSSSNHIIEDSVTVQTNRPIVWTAELR